MRPRLYKRRAERCQRSVQQRDSLPGREDDGSSGDRDGSGPIGSNTDPSLNGTTSGSNSSATDKETLNKIFAVVIQDSHIGFDRGFGNYPKPFVPFSFHILWSGIVSSVRQFHWQRSTRHIAPNWAAQLRSPYESSQFQGIWEISWTFRPKFSSRLRKYWLSFVFLLRMGHLTNGRSNSKTSLIFLGQQLDQILRYTR